MIVKSTIIILAVVLASAIIAGCAWSDSGGGKDEMLRDLTQCGRTQIAGRAEIILTKSRAEAMQLGLDLIFYNYATGLKHGIVDIKNLDLVISALARQSRDQTMLWALSYFAINPDNKGETPLPAREDDRVQKLMDLKTQFKSAVDYEQSSPKKAVSALQQAVGLCQQLRLDLAEALVLKRLGDHYHYDMERYSLAEAMYEQPTWLFPAYRCWAASAAVYDDFALLNYETGRNSTATDYYIQAARYWEQLANQDPSRYKYRNLVGREYVQAGVSCSDYTKALELMTTKGIGQIQVWANATKSYDLLIKTLLRVADFRRNAGDAVGALDLLEQALKTCERQNDPLITAKVLDGLGKTYTILKQPANLTKTNERRGSLLRDAVSKGISAIDKLSKSTTHPKEIDLGLRQTAEIGGRACQELRNYAKAADMWQRLDKAYKAMGYVDGQVRCLRALADVLDIQQKPKESVEARREAVMLARGANQNTLAASIVQEMIQSFIAMNDLDNALEGFKELAPIIEEAGNIRGAAQVLEARGALLTKNGYAKEAIDDLESAMKRYLFDVGDIGAAGQVALNLAETQKTAGKEEDALATLEGIIGEIEADYGSENSTSGEGEDHNNVIKNIYDELTRMYIHQNKQESANELFRRGRRYQWLSKLIVEMRTDSSDEKLAEWAKAMDVTVSVPNPPGSGEKRLASDWASFTSSCFWLEKQHPREYTALPIDPLDVIKARNRLPGNLLVVMYIPIDTSIYAFVIGQDRSICRQISVEKGTLDSLVSRLRKTLKNCEETLSAGIPIPPMVTWQESTFLEIKEPLVGLYDSLIAPIKDDIAGKQKLAFVLPSELTGLPMHALISPHENSLQPNFFVEDFEISYLSRGMLENLTGSDNKAIDPSSDWLAIFADPEGSLPGARKECDNIQSVYTTSRSYVGPDQANASSFIAECKQANILHIAAHNRIDSNSDGFQLLLAPDKTSNGVVGLQELAGISNSNLQLVVLSACDSVGSSDPISFGPIRLAEVFSLIGAKSVLGGLWKVSDEAASRVMSRFYSGLDRGKSRSEAIQSALRSVIESKQYAHPFYWACFALYGNPR